MLESTHASVRLDRRAVFGATVGNALEFYDFVTYSFFAIQIGRTFFPSDNQYKSLMLSLATFGVGFVTRPLGGVILGIYSDKVGRRPAMLLSFTLMGIAIVALALTPSYGTIGIAAPILVILARAVQGFSLGGEVGPTTAYLMEGAPIEHRGLTVSWQPASRQIAATAGALVGFALSGLLNSTELDSYGWRVAFFIGATTLPFGLWARAHIPETLHLAEPGVAPTTGESDWRVLRAQTRLLLLGLLIIASGTIITYVTNYMTTYAEHTLHIGTDLAFATTLLSNALGIGGALLGGWLADRAGRRPLMIWPQLAALLMTYPVFLWIVETRNAWALLGASAFCHWSAAFRSVLSMSRLSKAYPKVCAAAHLPRFMPSQSRLSAARHN